MANYKAGDLEKWAKKINRSLDQVIRATCLDLSSKIIIRTPVDTGRARGNWQASLSSPSYETVETTDKTGSIAIGNAGTTANRAAGNIFFLVNNLPYISKLEYGSSQQAPGGMVRVTVSEFTTALSRAVDSL